MDEVKFSKTLAGAPVPASGPILVRYKGHNGQWVVEDVQYHTGYFQRFCSAWCSDAYVQRGLTAAGSSATGLSFLGGTALRAVSLSAGGALLAASQTYTACKGANDRFVRDRKNAMARIYDLAALQNLENVTQTYDAVRSHEAQLVAGDTALAREYRVTIYRLEHVISDLQGGAFGTFIGACVALQELLFQTGAQLSAAQIDDRRVELNHSYYIDLPVPRPLHVSSIWRVSHRMCELYMAAAEDARSQRGA